MRAGKLDRTIVVQSFAAGTPNAAGTSSPTWTNFATVRAEIVEGIVAETVKPYGENDALTMTFRIRWLAGLTTDHRVQYEGRNLNIRAVTEIGRRRGLELRCEEVRS